jgi:oligoribonuclease
MKYVSIDIETSGLDTENNQVLSIGAVIEDTTNKLPLRDIPIFHAIVLQRQITGSPRALTMNKNIIGWIGDYLEGGKEERKELENQIDFYEKDEVAKAFYRFLHPHFSDPSDGHIGDWGKIKKPLLINVAGKNYGTFDNVFLKKLPWWQKLIIAKQRIIDPAVLFTDWKDDEALPSLTICKHRAGVGGIVTHDALEDAWDVVQVLRKFY